MKNIIYIDIDTSREKVVQIGKPVEFKPTGVEEAKAMILEDMSCVLEGLCSLIHIADQNNYGEKQQLVDTAIAHLKDMLKKKVDISQAKD